MAKKLIINADDFGIAEDINRGIVECFTQGAVTDISLLSVGKAFEHAGKLAKTYDIGELGVHLAVTGSFETANRADKVPSLVDKKGRFPKGYLSFLAKYYAGRIKKTEIYLEFKEQISKVKRMGFIITHLDSHQHIHMVPAILKIVVELAKEEGINYVRFPDERCGFFAKLKDPSGSARHFSLFSMCALSKKILRISGLKHNDFFIGHMRAHRLGGGYLKKAISNTKDGITELGCHPGYFTEEVKKKFPQYKNAEKELETLCDKNFKSEIKKHSIELVSCADV